MSVFEARDLGEACFFLGMSITRDRAQRVLCLGQQRAVDDLLEKYSMADAKPAATPISMSTVLTRSGGQPLDTVLYPYASLVGSLLHLSVCTRPDIAQAVGALSRYMSCPTTSHWNAAKAVLRYLGSTRNYALRFSGDQPGLVGYCDSDFASDVDTRRSTIGYTFILNGAAISWSSRRQQTVAASTTEAEYMSAAAAVKEALWLRKLLADFQVDCSPVNIKADSQSAIKLLKNPIHSQRCKHIDIIYHFARERVMRGEVCFDYVSTADMVADALTKAVPRDKFAFCRAGMGMQAL
jgi:hypothetical protein